MVLTLLNVNKNRFFETLPFEIVEKSIFIRCVEEFIFEKIKNKEIQIPVYLSAGQEYCASTVAYFFKEKKKYLKVQEILKI